MGQKHVFDSGIDLKQSELFNARLQNLFIFPETPALGQVVFRSDLNVGAFWSGTEWLFFGFNEDKRQTLLDISRAADEEGNTTQHIFPQTVKGLPAVNDDEFVTKSQVPVIAQYGLLNGGVIQYRGDGLWFQWAAAVVAIGAPLLAPFDEIELAAADATLNREDLLGWIKTGPGTAEAHVITGTPGPTFAPPPYDPTEFVFGISVKIPAAATVPEGAISTESIYVDNEQWTVTKLGTGTVDANSTDNPHTGTKAVKSTATANNYRVRFTRATTLDRRRYRICRSFYRLIGVYG
jgi:hypothetical protein